MRYIRFIWISGWYCELGYGDAVESGRMAPSAPERIGDIFKAFGNAAKQMNNGLAISTSRQLNREKRSMAWELRLRRYGALRFAILLRCGEDRTGRN